MGISSIFPYGTDEADNSEEIASIQTDLNNVKTSLNYRQLGGVSGIIQANTEHITTLASNTVEILKKYRLVFQFRLNNVLYTGNYFLTYENNRHNVFPILTYYSGDTMTSTEKFEVRGMYNTTTNKIHFKCSSITTEGKLFLREIPSA